MSSPKTHTWRSPDGMKHARAAFSGKAEARRAAMEIVAMTSRTYVPYRCRVCGKWHIRLLSRAAAARDGYLARPA